ncbi:MAG: VOC family protein [Gammaproteobacteria bacterium]
MDTATAKAAAKPIPEGMHSITPMLVCANASAAIDWYVRALGAVELSRLPGPDGQIMHAQLRIGDSHLMLTDECPAHGAFGPGALKGSPVTLHLYVEDVDSAFARAVEAGASVRMPVSDMFWGDRYGLLADPFGHMWSLATHLQDLTPDQIRANFEKMCG